MHSRPQFAAPPMNRDYWDRVAVDYESQVLSVFDQDAEGLVRAAITAVGNGSPAASAADLGCGVGKFVPILAEAFGTVEACDLSGLALERARSRCKALPNVRFCRLDLVSDPVPFEPVDFVLCVNVLLMSSLDQNLRAWRAVTNQVKEGGRLLLVVPSLESIHLERYREVEARLREGDSCLEALQQSLPAAATAPDLHQGVHTLDGLPTRHYLREELEAMLDDHGFCVESLRKLAYAPGPDGGMQHSWDWLVLAARR